MAARLPVRCALAVGLVAGTTLALQVLITRVLAAVLAYHFGFLAISLALLGVGAGAILVYVRPEWFAGDLEALLARWSIVLAALLVVMPFMLVRLDWAATQGTSITGAFVLTLALACVLTALPFGAAGVVVALAVRGYAPWIGRLYAFDLAGAGIGALVVVPVLWLVDGPTLLVALATFAAVAALLFGASRRDERLTAAAVTALAVVALVLAATGSLYRLDPNTSAPLDAEPVSDRWTPLSRVLTYAPPPGSDFALLFYDRVYAPVPVRRAGEPLPDWQQLSLGPQSIAYALAGPGRTLVIGGGGGRDIENALSSGQPRVDVIELNRAIRETVDEELAEYSGSPYSLPGVSALDGDGRSELAARDTKYDVIHIGFTDTLSANSAQGFALTEANLYTLEAFEEYFEHLQPGGVLAVSRLYHLVGDEALRATVLMLEALRREGADRPERNVVVVLGRDIFNELFGTVLARREPWTQAELARIRRLASERGRGLAFAPDGPYYREWGDLARSESPRAFCESYRLDVCAPTDDRPFFFNMRRVADIGEKQPPGYTYAVDPLLVLAVTLGILAVLCALAIVLPLVSAATERAPVTSMVYFAAIGLGFLLLEIALIQRFVLFLGFPTYALSVVLFALLVFTGAGALGSTRFSDQRRMLLFALGAACVLLLLVALVLPPVLRALIGLPFAARVGITVALLAPIGLLLGTAMPAGLSRLASVHPQAVPWAWGVNGVTSVVASVLAVVVAITLGFTAVTLLALLCYLVAVAHVALWRPRDRQRGREPRAKAGTTAA